MGKNTGFDNEKAIYEALNGKVLKDLNENLKNLIKSIFGRIDENSVIKCEKIGGQDKTDIKIIIGKESHTLSVKKGSGNSVHQEPVEDFIKYLEEEFEISEDIKNNLRFFIWGDGTLDGKGNINRRMTANEIKKNYPEKIKNIQDFFNKHEKTLLERFLVKGTKSDVKPDYVYYGTPEEGIWCKSDKIIEWMINNKLRNNKSIHIGRLTFQAWNRNIKGEKESTEKKRGHIQLKWGSIKEDLNKISKI
jgi:hypothetical protein